MAGYTYNKYIPKRRRDQKLILRGARQRAAERAEREPRRSVTPTSCLGCGDRCDQLQLGALCPSCADNRDRVRA